MTFAKLFGALLNFYILPDSSRCLVVILTSRQQNRRGWRAGAKEEMGLSKLNFWKLFRDSLAPGMPASPRGSEEVLSRWLWVTGHTRLRWLGLWVRHAEEAKRP